MITQILQGNPQSEPTISPTLANESAPQTRSSVSPRPSSRNNLHLLSDIAAESTYRGDAEPATPEPGPLDRQVLPRIMISSGEIGASTESEDSDEDLDKDQVVVLGENATDGSEGMPNNDRDPKCDPKEFIRKDGTNRVAVQKTMG